MRSPYTPYSIYLRDLKGDSIYISLSLCQFLFILRGLLLLGAMRLGVGEGDGPGDPPPLRAASHQGLGFRV